MYSLLLYLYQIGVFIASFFNEKVKKMWQGEQASFGVLKEKAGKDSEYIWFHAASLGEFEQARPIIERIKAETPQEKILLTFFSPSGYEVRKNYEFADIICYLPLDTPTNAARFLKLINIKKAYFIKYEFWWNYLHLLQKKHIPTYSVSSIFREEQIFFKWYNMQYWRVLKCFTHFFVQNEESLQLLGNAGFNNVTVVGDTRFDRVAGVKSAAKQFPIIKEFVKDASFTLVMGSSWQPDEEIVMPYFNEHPGMKLIIAPHEFDAKRLQDIMARTGRKAALYSTSPEDAASLDCLIIDSFVGSTCQSAKSKSPVGSSCR